jgi:CcmD family protein
MHRLKNVVGASFALLLLAVVTPALSAQEISGLPASTMGAQSLRPYWHVFIAYAIAIVLVLGWVVSIGRRLRDVEEKLGE